MWPTDNIPQDFLDMAMPLVHKQSITEREFIDLCKLAVAEIDSGVVPLYARSDMALYIANLWLNHENISSRDLLDEIGGQFAEWDIDGALEIENELILEFWERLKRWLVAADEKF